MYISNLYIQGFKSFLPKTELVFDNGITCIVGPNGCGKTNIVDAIRWILGEQKSSVLRSTKMNDVIFSGSKNRRPISFCEVSLIIHNDKGKLPIEYSDVEIKRRYYRNGESEYFINKNRCRLKDITDLFVDTGMGANAYSVIELKMIENILSHNTSERKIMIEEAAGISKYKNQKNSTINKLKSTQYDLERIKDLIGEIQANVNNLKLQMKRYNRYEKLSYEISDLDINISKIKISNLNKQINPLNDKIVKNAIQQNKFVIDEKKIKRSLEKTEFEYLELKNTYNTSEKELRQFEEMLSNINERLLINTEKYKSNQLLCSQYNDELVQSEINLTSSLERKNEMEKKVDDFAPIAERDKKKYEKLKSQYYRTNKDYDEKLKQLSIMRNEFDVHIDYIQQLYAKSERVKVYIEEKNNFVKQSLTNKSFLNKQKKDIVINSSNLKENIINFEKKNNQIANRIKKEIKKQNVLETEVIKLENDIISLINFIDNKKERLSFYEDLNDNFSGYSKAI